MSGMNIVTQLNPHSNGKTKQDITPEQVLKFLSTKITEYSALVEKQKAELHHSEVLLKGFITWQQEIQRKAGR